MKYRSCIAALGAGLCILSLPAVAQERAPVQARVKLNDLNLNSPAGRKTAQQRIEGAAKTACGDTEDGHLATSDSRQCKNEVRNSGAANVAMVQSEQRRAEGQRLAAERRMMNARVMMHRAKPARYRQCSWSQRQHKRVCVWRRR